MAEEPTSNMSTAGSSSTASPCLCHTCPQNVLILLDKSSSTEVFDFLSYHANLYNVENPNISITIKTTLNLRNQLLTAKDWDASIFPSQLVGSLVDHGVLWDMGPFLETSSTLQWAEILPFFRGSSAVYHEETDSEDRAVTRVIPLDGDILSMYYRRDLFEEYNVTIPRTWGEYNEAAAFFHGKALGPNGAPLFGSCVSRINECGNEYWASLILSSMTQTFGTSSGFLLNPTTMRTLLGPAMEETLRIMREQLQYGHDDELSGDCRQPNLAFNQGMCALTYNWGDQISSSSSFVGEIGVAPTPGSNRVMDRHSRKLVDCTESKCPYGVYYEDVGIVNRPSYSAMGGWMAGVNNNASDIQKYIVADFLAYVSNSRQSLSDILPNTRSNVVQPYRYSHTNSSVWVENGFEEHLASQYTEAIQQINSDNSVLELRVSSGDRIRDALDQTVFNYLMESTDPEQNRDEDASLRRKTRKQIERSINEIVRAGDRVSGVKLSDSYRMSIGSSHVTAKEFNNYINESFRDAAYGLSGFMCVLSVSLMIWTFRHRNNRVMKAFQPFLLIQSCCGLLLMSSSIIPLGFDDSFQSPDLLDVTCMLAPWLYVVGFTLFFSSVYAKIKECIKIYRNAKKCDILLVKPESSLRLTLRLLILNSVLLGLWTGSDPLKWKRLEVDGGIVLDDGSVETYGACQGGTVAAGFATALYALNMAEVLIASIQAFKCRFLVLEYNEMQWLPLSVFPFFEVWIIGGPILPLLPQESATVTFVLLSMMIVVSTGVGGMAVFAPKDWYIRKFYHASSKQNPGFPERTSSAGIMVLQHPTVSSVITTADVSLPQSLTVFRQVESQKQIDALSGRLGQIEGWNIELEIDIRMTKERFKELTKSEKFLFKESLMNEVITDAKKPTARSKAMVEDMEQTTSKSDDDDMAVLEQFERVWTMPDDDDDDEDQLDSMPAPRPSSFTSLHSMGSAHQLAESAPAYKNHLADRNSQDRGPENCSTPPPEDPLLALMGVDDDQEHYTNDDASNYSEHERTREGPSTRMATFKDGGSSHARVEVDAMNHRLPEYVASKHQRAEDDENSHDDVNRHHDLIDDDDSRHEHPEFDEDIQNGSDEDESIQEQRYSNTASTSPPPGRNSTQTKGSVAWGAKDDEELTEQELIAQIIALRLAAADAGEIDNDSVITSPEDPLERLMKMSGGDMNQSSPSVKIRPSIALGLVEQEREKALIARIVALRLAAADKEGKHEEDDDNSDAASDPVDPLERIMSMNAEDRLISAVNLSHYEDPTDEENDEENAIVHKKDFRDLSYMIQENDLAELERKATMLAASVKAKLTTSNLADLTTETMIYEDDSASTGYLALTTGGNKDAVNASNGMGGLDISRISDDGDRRFVSMSDSILDSPDRGRPGNGYRSSLLGMDSSVDDSRHSGRLRTGQSSGMEPTARKGLSMAAAAALDLDSDFGTQVAGEPSQSESGRRGLGFYGNAGKETIGDAPYRSPLVQGKKATNLRSPDSSDKNQSYAISDWAAVGGLANVLADFSDSQSATSYTGSGYADSAYAESSAQDSVSSSNEPLNRPFGFEPPIATELDKLVGTFDWEGANQAYDASSTSSLPLFDQNPPHSQDKGGLSALQEKRLKKRELEAEADAWRESISQSFTK